MGSARALHWVRQFGHQSLRRVTARTRHGLAAARDLLFPPACLFCRAELRPGAPPCELLCDQCRQRFASQRICCSRCAMPLPEFWQETRYCPRCHQRRYHFERAEALGEYRAELQQAVLFMKKLPFEPLTRAVGALLGSHLACRLETWNPHCVVPVPMHWQRRFLRGVHTSLVLGSVVAHRLGLPLWAQVLYCQRKLHKQGTLSPSDRFQNVRGAFGVSPGYDITDKRVLLVDDIMTTGATASEIARVLRRSGAQAVAVAVVARGIGQR